MATYVTSDAHGHLRALDRVLEQVGLGARDTLYVLGDMVDRGPDPVGVLRLVRSLPNTVVLAGNHEAMMLEGVRASSDVGRGDWLLNGGFATSDQLGRLGAAQADDLLDWVAHLPLFAVVEVPECRTSMHAGERRVHLLAHAGIDARRLRTALAESGAVPGASGGYGHVDAARLIDAMDEQYVDDLQWIRRGFWDVPTGLVGRDGRGPVVVAGHTPSLTLGRFAELTCGTGIDECGRGVVVEVGATRDTGGVPDRICVDCSAAAGWPHGRVGIMRLEDRRVWYADIEQGE